MLVLKTILIKKYLNWHDPNLITFQWAAEVIRYTIKTATKGIW